jgi:hypothetical protein
LIASLPPTDYNNDQGVAYWQWVNSYITASTLDAPSVVNVTDTAVGYPEIGYFKDFYLMNYTGSANQDLFRDVYLYQDDQDPTANFEYLFNLTGSAGAGTDPDPSSLFNVQTLKRLIELGQATVDITEDKDYTLNFGSDWDELTNTLGLGDNRRTYLIWMWLKYATIFTVNREQDGGNAQIGMLS